MYYDYGRVVFEKEMSDILRSNGLGRWYDVTDHLFEFTGNTFERVYLISTRDRDTSLIVFSCLDNRTDRVNDSIGKYVRIYKYVYDISGCSFVYLGKKKRINGMFSKLETYIVDCVKEIENSLN